jgi:hypothetical protein
MKIISHSYLKLFQSPLWALIFVTLLIIIEVINLSINTRSVVLENRTEVINNDLNCNYSLTRQRPNCQTSKMSTQSLRQYVFLLKDASQAFPAKLSDLAISEADAFPLDEPDNDKKANAIYGGEDSSLSNRLLSDMDDFFVNPDYILRSINKIYHRFEQII